MPGCGPTPAYATEGRNSDASPPLSPNLERIAAREDIERGNAVRGVDLAERFTRFAAAECRGVSPLYRRLAEGVALDPEILEIAARTRPGQPVPNALLAAVHALLLAGVADPLAAHYPSVSSRPAPLEDPYPLFRAFCLAHREEIVALISTRLIQTNEVRRCACLLPALGLVAATGGDRPLAMLEVGASAGLNLNWDRYGYDYGAGRRLGVPASPVQLTCEVRGELPPLPPRLQALAWRVGVDLSPVDLRDPSAVGWLRALVWPDQPERAALLEAAIALARPDPPRLLAGDALEHLPRLIAEAPADAALGVVHTHTLNQFTPKARERLEAILCRASTEREIWRIGIEGRHGATHAELELARYAAGARRSRRALARCEGHGEWIEWLAR